MNFLYVENPEDSMKTFLELIDKFSKVAEYKINTQLHFHTLAVNRKEIKKTIPRISLAVQWLELPASNVGGMGSISGWGSKIPYAVWYNKKKRKKNKYIYTTIKKYKMLRNKFNQGGERLVQ